MAILRATKTKTFDGPHIHEVYIDECQDNQIIDYELIFKLFDRTDSIFMAGDIAQCIARGLASPVIDLIQKFFPDSIDQLSPEFGEIDGPQPLIVENCNAETFFTTCINDKEEDDTHIEFRASQVVIVRDEKAKERVNKINKHIRPVFTVFDAKGLEFNDVILYNFFTDSPAGSKWRVILSALDDYDGGIQTFSHEKHYILSSELKHLYVAITRVRERLLIFDEDAELSEPIRTYWKEFYNPHRKFFIVNN
ncbi:13549_t:CDS:2 [Funneliformis geosporum]|nr:13549_t:CDS:2 [Funneliformis geosporum]